MVFIELHFKYESYYMMAWSILNFCQNETKNDGNENEKEYSTSQVERNEMYGSTTDVCLIYTKFVWLERE